MNLRSSGTRKTLKLTSQAPASAHADAGFFVPKVANLGNLMYTYRYYGRVEPNEKHVTAKLCGICLGVFKAKSEVSDEL